MKVRIERPQCVGNARCEAVSPDVYQLDEEGYIATDGFDVPDGLDESALKGAKACPERVIIIIEDLDGAETQVWPPVKN